MTYMAMIVQQLSCNDLRCSATFISYNASIQKVERKYLKDV